MTIGDWSWGETLFEGASGYYAAGRPPYAAEHRDPALAQALTCGASVCRRSPLAWKT
jgi:hypothetical protein